MTVMIRRDVGTMRTLFLQLEGEAKKLRRIVVVHGGVATGDELDIFPEHQNIFPSGEMSAPLPAGFALESNVTRRGSPTVTFI